MGGSSSQVVGYRYYAKFAAFIGNRIEKLIAINFDNRKWVLHDPTKHPVNMLPVREGNLFGENEGGVAGDIDIHFGYPDQEPNLEYQKHFPLVSGYPYQSYLLFRGHNFQDPFLGHTFTTPAFYLGNSGYMKEMLLWVKRTRVRNDGRGQWHEVRGDGAVVCEIGNFKVAYSSIKKADIPNFTYQFEVSPTANHTYSSGVGIKWVFGSSAYGGVENPTITDSISTKPIGAVELGLFDLIEININAYFETENYDISFKNAEILNIKQTKNQDEDGANSIQIKAICRPNDGFPYVVAKGTGTIYKNNTNTFVFQVASVTLAIDKAEYMDESGGVDINPIHKIREILTDDTAMGKPETDINDMNFMKAADRIWDEGLGVSWAIDEKSCIEAIEELCYHIEAGIRVNRQTGLYEMVLFRDDWFAEDEIHNISESRIKDLSLEVMNSDDIVNQLNVTYYDRERIKNSTFSVYENGSILTMGHANAESVDFPYFMHMRNAEIVANWKLKQFSTPAWSGSFTTGWKEARKWNRYDLIHLPWSRKWEGAILVRIMKINLGNGTDNTVTIDFEEVIPYSGEMNTSIVVDAPVESAPQPPQSSANTVFEAPYYLTVLRAGQTNTDLELSNNPDIGYIAAIAAKPQNNSLNALLYTDGGAGEFEQVSRLDYCDILQLDQAIDEITSSFVVTGSLTQTANSNNFILLNDELMGFVGFDTETKVLTVKRGVLDAIPKKHNSGNLFVFDLPDVAFDSTQYAQSEVVEAQVLTTTPSGIQELSATGVPVKIQSRAIRPYPPANVKINGEYWPKEIKGDLEITWSHRNRKQQTGGEMLEWYEDTVTPEADVTYQLEVYEVASNGIESTLLSLNIGSLNTYVIELGELNEATINLRIKLFSIRSGYTSYQAFEHTLATPLTPPSNLTAIFEV